MTNNHKMLDVPSEIAAIIAPRRSSWLCRVWATILCVRRLVAPGAPHSSLAHPNVSNVFRLHPRTRPPEDAWRYLTRAATHRSQSAKDFFAEVRVSDSELRRPVLEP